MIFQLKRFKRLETTRDNPAIIHIPIPIPLPIRTIPTYHGAINKASNHYTIQAYLNCPHLNIPHIDHPMDSTKHHPYHNISNQPPPQMTKPEVPADALNQFMTETRSFIWSLETQIGQLAKLMADRKQGALPSSKVVNPKEQCQYIIWEVGLNMMGI